MGEAVSYSVSELNSLIKDLVEGSGLVNNVQVVGEISNFKKYPSGHCYFTLKDATGILKCVMFRYRAVNLTAMPENGDTVLAVGRIGVYERDGLYQLYVDMLIPQGVGDLMKQYEKLKEKLGKEGLFDEDKKQELPLSPETVGIITSSAGAAVRDIITVIRRRNIGTKLRLFPVKVQGDGAAEEIAAAIEFMNKHKLADVLIVGRGGGSIEDLWAFNEEVVVRAIGKSKIPVISSVGHEVDFTLADFVADKRAATPSQAAEFAVVDANVYIRDVQRLTRRNSNAILRLLDEKQAIVNKLARARVLSSPELLLEPLEQRLDQAQMHLNKSMTTIFSEKDHAFGILIAKLDSLSPLTVLSRGYSVTMKGDGKRLKSIDDANWGEEIVTKLQDGDVISVVQHTERRENYGK